MAPPAAAPQRLAWTGPGARGQAGTGLGPLPNPPCQCTCPPTFRGPGPKGTRSEHVPVHKRSLGSCRRCEAGPAPHGPGPGARGCRNHWAATRAYERHVGQVQTCMPIPPVPCPTNACETDEFLAHHRRAIKGTATACAASRSCAGIHGRQVPPPKARGGGRHAP